MYAYKVEIEPTERQKILIHQNMGVCRFIYNAYIYHNQIIYEKEKRFVSANEFDKFVNHTLKKEFNWIQTCHTKARKQAIKHAENAFLKFFTGKAKFPKFKKKHKQEVKIYLPKNNRTDFQIERHRAKLPLLGFVKLKEKGYIPTDAMITSCTISQKGNRYYSSFLTKGSKDKTEAPKGEGVGIDVGLKEFAVLDNGMTFSNINHSRKIRRLETTLKRAKRRLSRKFERRKKRIRENPSENRTYGSNLQKNITRVQNLHRKLTHIRENYLRHVTSTVAKTKPRFITIEKLNVKGMMKNKHLSKVISNQGFYKFVTYLIQTCRIHGIELRQVDTFFPSSKTCSQCGTKKTKLSLSERTFTCECGWTYDRDVNAAINLKQATKYKILT